MFKKLIALAIVAVIVIAASSACTIQGACSGNFLTYCAPMQSGCNAAIVNGNQWESGPLSGPFMAFNHQDTIQLFLNDSAGVPLGGTIIDTKCNVSPSSDPTSQFVNEDVCAWGQSNTDGSIFLQNQTCADYFVRALITVAK
jgi:hypothetical protein